MLETLILAGLAGWRLCNLVVYEAGPFDVFRRLREKTGVMRDDDGFLTSYPPNNPLHCVWCSSLYIAPLVLALYVVASWLVLILAISAIACIINAWQLKSNIGELNG